MLGGYFQAASTAIAQIHSFGSWNLFKSMCLIWASNFILLPMDAPLSQHHFFKRLPVLFFSLFLLYDLCVLVYVCSGDVHGPTTLRGSNTLSSRSLSAFLFCVRDSWDWHEACHFGYTGLPVLPIQGLQHYQSSFYTVAGGLNLSSLPCIASALIHWAVSPTLKSTSLIYNGLSISFSLPVSPALAKDRDRKAKRLFPVPVSW